MNTFEFYRAFEKIKISDIRTMAVEAAQYAEREILNDSKLANLKGETFDGGQIEGVGRFSDWFDTGEFHSKLKFLESSDIEFISSGEGFEAIKDAFSESNWIAPHARTLSDDTKSKLKKYFIDFFIQQLQINAK
jgi:hypothetical protein